MFIRSMSWGRGDLSWSRVMERLLLAADRLGSNSLFISTNGYQNMDYWSEDRSRMVAAEHQQKMSGRSYDIDITYTLPINFRHRFLKNSSLKIGRYDYESSVMPPEQAARLNDCDLLCASSQFVADIFITAGANPGKLRILHSGVDRDIFSTVGSTADRSSLGAGADTHIFLCVSEPHYRKQLDVLLDVYCSRFTAKDDVLLVLKSKFFEPGQRRQSFEMDLRPYISALISKYGANLPKMKFLGGHIKSLAPLYRAADTFVLPTVGEGWGMPFLEAMACGNLVIAPRYGGQLEFLDDNNSLLCPVKMRPALPQEQYGYSPNAHFGKHNGVVGAPSKDAFGDLMIRAAAEHKSLKLEKQRAMIDTANRFTWEAAARQLLSFAG